MPADSYAVDVNVEGDRFLAEVRGIPGGAYGENRTQQEQHVREVIILGADLPDDATPAFAVPPPVAGAGESDASA